MMMMMLGDDDDDNDDSGAVFHRCCICIELMRQGFMACIHALISFNT